MSHGPGVIQRKVLLLLLGGLALGLSGSPRRHLHILKRIGREWQNINRQALRQAIRGLYQSKLVAVRHAPGGSVTLELSEDGRRSARTYKMNEMKVLKPERWDGKWRIIAFDIPEEKKKAREGLRVHLRQLGFKELQKSVFVCPYPCNNEVDFLIEFYQVRPYVRKILAESIDTALHLKQRFGLLRSGIEGKESST